MVHYSNHLKLNSNLELNCPGHKTVSERDSDFEDRHRQTLPGVDRRFGCSVTQKSPAARHAAKQERKEERSVCLSLSINKSICLSIIQSIYLSIHQSVNQSISQSIYPFIYVPTFIYQPPTFLLLVRISAYFPNYLSDCPFVLEYYIRKHYLFFANKTACYCRRLLTSGIFQYNKYTAYVTYCIVKITSRLQ
jgi:hypothetical protein